MKPLSKRRRTLIALAPALVALAALAPLPSHAQPAPTVRLRGTIQSLEADKLVLRDAAGRSWDLALAPNLVITEAHPLRLEDIKPNDYIGSGAMPQPDGTQRAIAVLVFPDAMRGTGEGHRPFDFLPQSTMTNATVAGTVTTGPEGPRLRVTYPGGEKTIVVPPEAPVFTMRPGTRDLLAVGNRISLAAQEVGGKPTATRIMAGRNGFSPPY